MKTALSKVPRETLAKRSKPYMRFGVERSIWVQLEGRGRTISVQAALNLRDDLNRLFPPFDARTIKRYERGWAGHFIGSQWCLYHRNTLVEKDDGRALVVSTIGRYRPMETRRVRDILDGRADGPLLRTTDDESIGVDDRIYESMIFAADTKDEYRDPATGTELAVDGIHRRDGQGEISADAMHEAMVERAMREFDDLWRRHLGIEAERAAVEHAAVLGRRAEISISCNNCDGTGRIPNDDSPPSYCLTCGGSGFVAIGTVRAP